MMLTNNRKAEQAKGTKTQPEFDSILEQILSLDTQKKTSESRSMKTASKETKKSAVTTIFPCPYCRKGGHIEDKCYYKHPERASDSFRERFKDRIADLKSRHSRSATTAHQESDSEATTDSRNHGWMVRTQQLLSNSALSTSTHDSSWYFDNAASFHMTYDSNDFETPEQLSLFISPQGDITLADGSVVVPDGIGKVWFNFEVSGCVKRLFLSGV